MSKAKPTTKTAGNKQKASIKELDTRKDPKGGPSPKVKRVIILPS